MFPYEFLQVDPVRRQLAVSPTPDDPQLREWIEKLKKG
jgi:hypothetical protein